MYHQTRREMYEVLINYFSLGELRTLAFDLNIEFEDLSGETKSTKALSLIEFADRRGRLDDLVRYVMRLRPNVEWPKQDTQSESLININIGNVGQGSVIGKGALIRADNIAGRDITISEQFLEKKDDFKGELKELRQQIEVILSEEQLLSKPSLLMLENLQDIIEHASSSAPNARWIILRLEDTRRILKESFSVV